MTAIRVDKAEQPKKWTDGQLETESAKSAAFFRTSRLAAGTDWAKQYTAAKSKFDSLFHELSSLSPGGITDVTLRSVYGKNLEEALRYLAGPPVSKDDLKVLAAVKSTAPGVLRNNKSDLLKVFSVIEKIIDPYRFPWVVEKREPTDQERAAALVASSVLLAAQRIATHRRSTGKTAQEQMVKDLLFSIGFSEVPPRTISTLMKGPQACEFCGECMLGERKADIVVRLHDTRLMPIECKVTNSATNSVKRVNNDAVVKAGKWIVQFGTDQVVPSAVVSGVIKTLNLRQAQNAGLSIFWAHDLTSLANFIDSTRPPKT